MASAFDDVGIYADFFVERYKREFGGFDRRSFAGVVASCVDSFEIYRGFQGGGVGGRLDVAKMLGFGFGEGESGGSSIGLGSGESFARGASSGLGKERCGRDESVVKVVSDVIASGVQAGCVRPGCEVGGRCVNGELADDVRFDDFRDEREGMRVVLGGELEDDIVVKEVDVFTGKVIEGESVVKKKKYKSSGREDAMKAVLAGERDMSTLTGAQRRKVEKKLLDRAQKAAVSAGAAVSESGGVNEVSTVGSEERSVPEWRRSAGAFCARGVKVEKEKSPDPLRESLERKWMAKNALEAKKAERELALLNGEDIEAVKGLREKKLRAATEKAMVQTERAHAVLAATGNVPGVQPGFCETVVDGEIVSGSATRVCSISPSSSISEKEVRQMQKEYADLLKRNEEKDARISDLENALELYKRGEKVDAQVSRMYCESVPVTVNSDGEVPADVLWKAGDKYEGKEFLEIGPLVGGKRTVKFDRYAFSRSGAYSKDYEAFDTY